jgi:cyanophycinase-like exopeptidase
MRILPNTRVLAALQDALQRGVLIAGSSGGAMLMGARSEVVTPELAEEIGRVWENGAPPDWDPPLPEIIGCLGWVAHGFCAPHFNRVFPWKWLERGVLAEGEVMIGIDEQTALVLRTADQWEVRGLGAVTLIWDNRQSRRYAAGDAVML